jgi:hypothetical protein
MNDMVAVVRHSCVYKGRRFAHLVLAYQGKRVSLIMTEGGGRSQPDASRGSSPRLRSAGLIDGMTVVSFRAPRHVVFFTGDVPLPELVALADAVAGPIYSKLAGV